MAEPISTTTAGVASGSLGLLALLIGWFGPAGADVFMVALSAAAGSVLALSGIKNGTLFGAAKFVGASILLALITSWMLANFIVGFYPAAAGPYLPSMVAFVIGAVIDRIPALRGRLISLAENKIGGE